MSAVYTARLSEIGLLTYAVRGGVPLAGAYQPVATPTAGVAVVIVP